MSVELVCIVTVGRVWSVTFWENMEYYWLENVLCDCWESVV